MNPLDLFDYSKMKARPSVCLMLFLIGGALSMLIDVLGVGSFTVKPSIALISLPVPDVVVLAGVYGIAAVIVGLMSKTMLTSMIYGSSLGQCQFLATAFIGLFFVHSDDPFLMVLRCLCGIPYTTFVSFISFNAKKLLTRRKK